MSSMNFDFLNGLQLEEIVPGSRKQPVEKNLIPKDADLRLFWTGKLYPSVEFAEANNLQFQTKTTETSVVENGVDIFSSEEWGMVKGKLPQKVLFISVVPKSLPKVDVWGNTRYNEDGTPKADVFTQGGGTFVKQRLLNLVADVFDIDWETTKYVDIKVGDAKVESKNGVYHLPSVVSTGPKKGEATYKVRNNITINPIFVTDSEPREIEVKVVESEGVADLSVLSIGPAGLMDRNEVKPIPEDLGEMPVTTEEACVSYEEPKEEVAEEPINWADSFKNNGLK